MSFIRVGKIIPNALHITGHKRALEERTYFSYNIKGKNHGRLAYSPFPIRTSDAGKIKRKRKRSFCSKENIMDYCKNRSFWQDGNGFSDCVFTQSDENGCQNKENT